MTPAALILVGFGLFAIAAALVPQLAGQAPAADDRGADAGDGLADPAADVPMGQGAGLLAQFGVTVARLWTPPPAADPYLQQIAAAEMSQGLPDGLLARVLYQESRFRPDIVAGETVSPAGALGIAQFMPATARDLGIDPLNPDSAIRGSARYLRQLFDQLGSWPQALAAYNWGIGNVKRKGIAAAPAETRAYVDAIAGDLGLS